MYFLTPKSLDEEQAQQNRIACARDRLVAVGDGEQLPDVVEAGAACVAVRDHLRRTDA